MERCSLHLTQFWFLCKKTRCSALAPMANLMSILTFLFLANPALGAGQEMMRTRVPADKLQEARALTNPLTATPEILEKGKAIYEGKGTCFNCHGMSGRGDGPGAATLDPPPRVFKSHGFWKHRTEGEIFWVIKYGSPGTAMIPFGGLLTDEEIWTVMLYERSFAGGHGGRRGGSHGASGMEEGQGKGHGEHEGKGGCCRSEKAGYDAQHHEDRLRQAEQASKAPVTIDQAIKTAKDQVGGTVIEAEFETEMDTSFWEVEVLSADGKIMKAHVDSTTGTILSVEEKTDKKKRMRKRSGGGKDHEAGHGCCSSKEGHEHDGSHREKHQGGGHDS